jgi:hypothetical protein
MSRPAGYRAVNFAAEPSSTRTTAVAVAPAESITVTRENPGPSGRKNSAP